MDLEDRQQSRYCGSLFWSMHREQLCTLRVLIISRRFIYYNVAQSYSSAACILLPLLMYLPLPLPCIRCGWRLVDRTILEYSISRVHLVYISLRVLHNPNLLFTAFYFLLAPCLLLDFELMSTTPTLRMAAT